MDVDSAFAVLAAARNNHIETTHPFLIWSVIVGNGVSAIIAFGFMSSLIGTSVIATPRENSASLFWKRCSVCVLASVPLATLLGCARLAALIVNDPATWKPWGVPKLAFGLVSASLLTGYYCYVAFLALCDAFRESAIHRLFRGLGRNGLGKK